MGTVIWITGLPGTGKSTIGAALLPLLQASGTSALWLDGDAMRSLLWPDAGYDLETRRKLGLAYARLAAHLAAQGPVVVVTVVALFEEVRAWLRSQPLRYIEVWVDCPEPLRRARIPHLGQRGPEVGTALVAELPTHPDLHAVNDDRPGRIDELARQIHGLWLRDAAV